MKDKTKKFAGLVLAGVALAGVGGAVGYGLVPTPEPKIITVQEPFVVEKVVTQEVPVEKIVEVPVTVTETVEDTDFLKLVCDRMMYEDIMECKDEVQAEDSALKQALELINDEQELFDFLEDEGFVADEDEARLIKVYDDFEDIEVLKSDFDDERYEFKVMIRYEDEDEDFKAKAYVTVSVDEGELEFVDVEEA